MHVRVYVSMTMYIDITERRSSVWEKEYDKYKQTERGKNYKI